MQLNLLLIADTVDTNTRLTRQLGSRDNTCVKKKLGRFELRSIGYGNATLPFAPNVGSFSLFGFNRFSTFIQWYNFKNKNWHYNKILSSKWDSGDGTSGRVVVKDVTSSQLSQFESWRQACPRYLCSEWEFLFFLSSRNGETICWNFIWAVDGLVG